MIAMTIMMISFCCGDWRKDDTVFKFYYFIQGKLYGYS
jgi:hypothetical protein